MGRGSGLLGRVVVAMAAGDKGGAESCDMGSGAEKFLDCVVDFGCKDALTRVAVPIDPSFPPTNGTSPAKSASRRSLGERGASRAEPVGEIGDRGECEEAEMAKLVLRGLAEDRAGLFRSSPDTLDVRLA